MNTPTPNNMKNYKNTLQDLANEVAELKAAKAYEHFKNQGLCDAKAVLEKKVERLKCEVANLKCKPVKGAPTPERIAWVLCTAHVLSLIIVILYTLTA